MTNPTGNTNKKRSAIKIQGKTSVMTTLEDLFGPLTDEELIADLSTRKSLRDYALKGMEGFGPEKSHHQAILYYLETKRPNLLQRMNEEGRELAQGWPNNFRQINAALRAGGWWSNGLLKRFRDELRVRMKGLPVTAWVETIWTVAPDIVEDSGVKRVPSKAEVVIYQNLHLPSAIHHGFVALPRRDGSRGPLAKRPTSKNLAPEIRKALRHRLKAHFEQTT